MSEVHVPVIVVDKVTETRSVHDGEAKTDTILFNVCDMVRVTRWVWIKRETITGTDALDSDGLRPFSIRSKRLLGGIEGGVEEGIDQG